MVKKNRFVLIIAAILFCSSVLNAEPESFRVSNVHTIQIPEDFSDLPAVNASYNDGIYVQFPSDIIFLQSVEFQITLPKNILPFHDFLGYAIYSNVHQRSQQSAIDFSGNRELLQQFPSKLNCIVQIPVKESGLKSSSPYATVVESIVANTELPVFLRLLPIMKGLPDTIDSYVFEIKVKPILINKGRFTLSISAPESNILPQLTVSIDDNVVDSSSESYLLDTGMHHVTVIADDYRTAMRTFSIEQGKTTSLDIELQDTVPMIQLIAPENAIVLFDGQPAPEEMLRSMVKTEPGEHNVTFTIGDYEIHRTIVVEKAKNYSVSLLIDVETTIEQ